MPQGPSTIRTWRFDTFELPAAHELENGSLAITARVSRPGVLEYKRADGSIRRELVPEETLQDPEHLAGYALKPVTAPHPKRPVTPSSHKRDAVGSSLQRVQYAGGYVEVALLVDDERGIKRIKQDGWREISAGYAVELDETPGEHPDHGPYDAIQVARTINHLAIVPKGRAGSSVAMRFDGLDVDDLESWHTETDPDPFWFYRDDASPTPTPAVDDGKERVKEILIMPQIQIDGVTVDVPDASTAQLITRWRKDMEGEIESAKAEAQKAQESTATVSAEKADVEGERDKLKMDMESLQAKHDALAKDMEDMKAKFDARKDALTEEEWKTRTKERARLDAAIKHFRIESTDGKTAAEIKRQVVTSAYGEIRQDASDIYIDGMFDAACKKMEDRNDSYDFNPLPTPGENAPGGRQPIDPTHREDSMEEAEKSYEHNAANAWKKKSA